MSLLITAHPANDISKRLILRVGQEARVGSSEWVELSIPDDATLSPEHFVVRCGADAVFEVLDEQEALIVQGDALKRFTLSDHGECEAEFLAGQTTFTVRWSPEVVNVATPATCSSPQSYDVPQDDHDRIVDIADSMSLSEAATQMIQSPDSMLDYVERLIKSSLHDDAIRLVAGGLPVCTAINWAIKTAGLMDQGNDPSGQKDSLKQSMLAWTATGNEMDRRQVRDQLTVSKPDNVTRWIAQAIVLSGGSLGPDDQPPVPPPAHLSGIAILTAHRWSVAAQPDRDAAMTAWLESGSKLLQLQQDSNQGSE
ncbi:DUF6931 family protein [Neorhodopirellula lusitana]|uniref:DUF6931 family protein n=1 Tax=Neorhodopirellula lusitana TaxID=445327 RepID=UPI00384CD401